MKIHAVLLSEFNDQSGFRLIAVHPKDTVTQNQFSLYSELVLAREELCGRMIAIEFMRQFILLGVPNISYNKDDKKVYERAKFIYSLNILVHKQMYLKTMAKYKQMAKKLSYFFKFMEESSNTIYNNGKNNEYLDTLLKKIHHQINHQQQCVISHLSSSYTIVDVNSIEPPKKPITIRDYYVPITLMKEEEIHEVQSLLGKNLLKFAYSGEYNMKKICSIIDKKDQINRFYTMAYQQGLVHFVDMFDFQNRYALTQQFLNYLPDQKLHKKLPQICKAISEKQKNPIDPTELLILYSSIRRKRTLRDCIVNKTARYKKINIVKWIRLSQILNIITRVYEKIALQGSSDKARPFIKKQLVRKVLYPEESDNFIEKQYRRLNEILEKHLNEMKTIDEICVNMELNKSTLMELLNNRDKELPILYVIDD